MGHDGRGGAALTSALLENRRLDGHLRDDAIHTGVARGPLGLYQRRVRPSVFGEPLFDAELVPAAVCAARPHQIAWDAWRRMVAAAEADGLDSAPLAIHAGYRSVAFQAEIWAYRVEERRRLRAEAGLPPLSEPALKREQRRYTAEPGQSAHHTGFALDLALYHLGLKASRQSPAYVWLCKHARRFGFYPYLPEAWHWEYNPPGLAAQLRELRAGLTRGQSPGELLSAPKVIPVAPPSASRPITGK